MVCAALTLGAGATAHAGVIEIGDDGAVRERGDTAAVSWVVRDRDPHAALPIQAPRQPAPALTGSVAVPVALRAPLAASAARYGVSPHLLAAVVWQESRFHTGAVSPKGAIGLTQLMPSTARAMAVDPRDPVANLNGGAHYLRNLLDQFGGHVDLALAAYNAGAGRVIRHGGIPPFAETRAYVSSIMRQMQGGSALMAPVRTALARADVLTIDTATPATGIIDTGFQE